MENNVSKSPGQGVGKIQGQENKQETGCPHEYVYQKMDNLFHDRNTIYHRKRGLPAFQGKA
jgi:hypothetical protein